MAKQTNDVDVNVGEFPDTVQEERPLVISEFHFMGLVNSILNGSWMDEHGAVSINLSALLFRDEKTEAVSDTAIVMVDCLLPNDEEMSVDLIEHLLEITGEASNFPYTSVQAELNIQQLKDVVKEAFRVYGQEPPPSLVNFENYTIKTIDECFNGLLLLPVESFPSLAMSFSCSERQSKVIVTLMQDDIEIRSSSVLLADRKTQ